jgi:branched-chain amino acid transport system substrate-binding protein
VVTIGKALLFPSVIESLGNRGDGLTSEIWWTPTHPFNSSLTGDSAKALADGYTADSGRPWTQPIGFKHALFEVVRDVIARSADLDDPMATVDAIKSTSLSTIVGDINWANGPVPNVTKTPLVAGQWQMTGDVFDLVVTTNAHAPQIPLGGDLRLLG